MNLTPHQAAKIEELRSCIKQGHRRIVLQGSAGTGKTWLAREYVQDFISRLSKSKWAKDTVYITAPTNKALSILQAKMPSTDNIAFKTTHSSLKLRRVIDDKRDSVSFVPSYSEKNRPFEGCVLGIVDECSMLETRILNMLDDFTFPIIFVGDNKQLNPIGEPFSPVFGRGYPVIELTEIIRQGEGNPIIELSQNLALIKSRIPNLTSEGFGYTYENNKEKLIAALAEVNGTDELKYLAYTNAEVQAINNRTRQLLYGNNPAKVEKAETLVFNAPKGEYWTNKEVKVENVEVITEQISIPTSYSKFHNDGIVTNCDKLKMKVYRINEGFNIVHEHSERMAYLIQRSIEENCAKFGWNWKGKYFFKEQFADITYNHAITIHKSQGSTYEETILNVNSINICKKIEERKRLLYTGVTRAAKTLILNNV